MSELNATDLVELFSAAARRHDDFAVAYSQHGPTLLKEFNRIVQGLIVPAKWNKKPVFVTRLEQDGAFKALVVGNNLVTQQHPLALTALTIELGGITYHPSDGTLVGVVGVYHSYGDYRQFSKIGSVSFLEHMTYSMIDKGMPDRIRDAKNTSRRIQLENTKVETIDLLWMRADEVGTWYCQGENGHEKVSLEPYMYWLLELLFNPECKNWVKEDS